LAACANNRPSRWRTRRFLTGLSSDELQFIAEYLGSRILDSSGRSLRAQSAPPGSRDLEHKMILLLEFLGRTGLQQTPLRASTPRWN
jgi:hypothetical protein